MFRPISKRHISFSEVIKSLSFSLESKAIEISFKMTTKTVLIAKVVPIRQKDNKFIEIKVKNLGNLSEFSETITQNMITESEKTKRKRERLDHLTEDQKIKRR